MKEELIRIKIDAKNHIALWKRTTEKCLDNKHILFTHGTFSSRKVFNAITDFLTNQGFTCWVFEWRNHGDSSKMKHLFNFETIGKEDFKLIFNYLFDEVKIEKLSCITHSGGGICLTIALINYPKFKSKINCITMFACQGFGAAVSTSNYIKICMSRLGSKLLGYTPAKALGRETNETYYLMKQWFDWNLTGRFYGENGINYQSQMPDIKTPIFSIYGKGDTFVAPKEGCELFLSSFDNPLNKALFCSKAAGFLEDYNHSRVLHSRSASKEIYPFVLDWLDKNKTKKK